MAHRLALDHPKAVRKLMILDIQPTLWMYEHTNMTFVRSLPSCIVVGLILVTTLGDRILALVLPYTTVTFSSERLSYFFP